MQKIINKLRTVKKLFVSETGKIVAIIKTHPYHAAACIAGCLILIICVILVISYYRKKRKMKEQMQALKESSAAGEDSTGTERGRTEVTEMVEIPEEPERIPKNGYQKGYQIGKVHEIGARQDQQDSFFVSDSTDVEMCRQRGLLGIVADGMGGLSNGGAVSSLAVRTCMEVFYQQPGYVSVQDTLLKMAAAANAKVNQLQQGQGRSGSTLVLAVIKDGYLYFLTIGDSRIYLYRNEALMVLNREHIFQEELALRAVNQEESMERVKNDPQTKSLTSYMGIGYLPHLDRNREGIKLKKGDKIILSSDGVFGTLTQEQMEEALTLEASAAAGRLQMMVEEAGAPHQDNYTAIIIEYEG